VEVEPGECTFMIGSPLLDSDRPSDTGQLAHLLKQAKAGNVNAFEQILLLHQRQVLMTCLRLLGELKDAQDAAQEVFLRLYKYLHRFDDGRDFAPWLYRITVNVCRDAQRKRHRTSALSLEELCENSEMPEPRSSTDPEAEFSIAEKRQLVSQALLQLPTKERAALVLRDIEGLSTREVAAILGSSEVTVRSQISSARLKIKKFVDRHTKRRL
jgi:RNA polymerase sigma-70 factor (ECF subfamily)